MHITQDTNTKTRSLELGGGLEDSDGGEHVIVIEERKEQVEAKGGGTQGDRLHVARSLL